MEKLFRGLFVSLSCVSLVLLTGCGGRCSKHSKKEKELKVAHVDRIQDKKHSRTEVYEPMHHDKKETKE